MTDGLIADDGITYGAVSGIFYVGKEPIYGIQTGMTLDQVEELLGAPNNKYTSQHSELYADDQLILQYRAGSYAVDFEIGGEDKTVQSISIWKANQ